MPRVELSRLRPLAEQGCMRWPPERTGYIALHEGAGHHANARASHTGWSELHNDWLSNYTIHAYPRGGLTGCRAN